MKELVDLQMSSEFNNGRVSFKAINPEYLLKYENKMTKKKLTPYWKRYYDKHKEHIQEMRRLKRKEKKIFLKFQNLFLAGMQEQTK